MLQAGENTPVDAQVHGQCRETENNLKAAGEHVRIENRYNVVLDEAAPVSHFPALSLQIVFQGGEGAGPAGKLDQDSPDGCGEMEPQYPSPAQEQQAAEHHKEHEAEMHYDNNISEETVYHECSCKKALPLDQIYYAGDVFSFDAYPLLYYTHPTNVV